MQRLLTCLLFAATLAAGETEDASSRNAFACRLFAELAREEGNVFVSPWSVAQALSMTWVGARGQTAAEMGAVLGFSENTAPETAAARFALGHDGAGKALRVANGLFAAKGYPFLPAFLALNQQHFGAGLEACDFAGQADAERRRINAWVATATADEIRDLLGEGSVTADTRLVLVNAVLFKGDWTTPFDPEATEEQPFRVFARPGMADEPPALPLMRRIATLPYAETKDLPGGQALPPAQVCLLPYEGDCELMLLLPTGETRADLTALVAGLDRILAVLPKVPMHNRLDLVLPRFRLRWGSTSLKPALAALGMPTVFTQAADLGGISSAERLLIDDVIHQATVTVDEAGTVAAAATGVLVAPTAIMEDPPPPPVVLRIDRPFLALIRHRPTGLILFAGRIERPEPAPPGERRARPASPAPEPGRPVEPVPAPRPAP